MTRYADYSPEGTPVGRCVILPGGRGYDAAWLTPVLTEPVVAESLASYPARQFVVIGSSDPYLRQDVLDALPGQCLVVPGDHILRVSGDIAATVASHDRFIRAFDEWLGLADPS